MRVRCIRQVDDRGEDSSAGDLEIGREYVVLEMQVELERARLTCVRISLEQETYLTPVLVPARAFETSDGRIPSNWTAQINAEPNGRPHLDIGPAPWLRVGFWEDWSFSRRDALVQYETELQVILRES